MNIIINSEEFVSHLNNIVGVVDRKQSMPILGHILMSGMSGEITITATDLEVQISNSFKANITEDFSITLPGRKLFDILRSI
jgi:DNA polymerase sliding clamp subunit (PCNA homolog)